ncbi:putative glycine cleavage system T protein, aminomethyltransferase [Rhizobium freirei PRF 81]|uniref:Putative glycine cleavage system T protein, aminomethyltransferase n=1 Tax=Rhizobium freirei PRF 81 TaxID=363754 RepID=N6U7N2_9HYPH|nr:folate-binding protein YgfZ [Rhizobium freirei]ENN86288.1 putative glycine cleavage system T protein, aminomethyltransferase [Rhizobium freirei PRF 81]
MPAVFLKDRSFIRVAGTEVEAFLHNLITTDLASLATNEVRPGALLTPQGKILFDFMIRRDGPGFLIETDATQQEGLLKRLTMYRLRAKIDFSVDDVQGVTVAWAAEAGEGPRDSRFLKADIALTRTPGQHGHDAEALYDELRIASGIAVSGRDFALQDAFPHDVMMDINGGLGFRKGCYIGQEVVSRMHHRGTARRRVVIVDGTMDLPVSGTELTAGGKPMGSLGSIAGRKGLAVIRIDRAGEAIATGTPILAGEVEVSVSLPTWSGLTFPAPADEASA